MKFRQVQSAELPQLLDIARHTFVDTFAHLNNPEDFDVYLKKSFTIERIKSEFDTTGSQFYFIEDDNTILGFVKLNFDKSPAESDDPTIYDMLDFFKAHKGVEIERIYVLPNLKGKGIGRFAIDNAESLALDFLHQVGKTSNKYIWLGVWSENVKAIAFYEKMGFKTIGEHVFMMGSNAQTDFLMYKELK